MTTSVSTRSPGTLNPTRQQLDELDALLQRMLELPVNKLDDTEQEETEGPAEEQAPPATDQDGQTLSLSWSSEQPPEDAEPSPLPLHPWPATPPVSYMVVETASPRPVPPASGFEPQPSSLTPRLVPVTPREEETDETLISPEDRTGETPVPPAEVPSAPVLPQPRLSEMPVPSIPTNEDEVWVPLRSTWQPSAQTWQPLAESWHQAHSSQPMAEPDTSPILGPHFERPLGGDASQPPTVDQPEPPATEPTTTEETSVTPASTATEPQLRLSGEDAPVAVPPSLLPLLWFNQGFDSCLVPLGAPGRWLCGPRGRQMLGFIGLASLAAAIAIAVSAGMGWTW